MKSLLEAAIEKVHTDEGRLDIFVRAAVPASRRLNLSKEEFLEYCGSLWEEETSGNLPPSKV